MQSTVRTRPPNRPAPRRGGRCAAGRRGPPAAMPGTLAERAGEITLAYALELARPGPRREDYRLQQGEDDTLAGGWQRLAAGGARHHPLLRDLARSVAPAQSAAPPGPAMPAVPARPGGRDLSAFPAAPERDELGQRRLRAAAH